MEQKEYKQIFGDVKLREDSKAKGRWETNHGGEYYAAGVGGSITGRGADLLIIDDPHTEQDALSESAMERAYDWYVIRTETAFTTGRLNRYCNDKMGRR
jgi:hypothetical protein